MSPPTLSDTVLFAAPTFADRDHPDSKVEPNPEAPGYRDRGGVWPAGEALAGLLSEGLGARWEVPAVWATPYGHAFEARSGPSRFDLELRLVGDARRDWHLTIEPRRGLLGLRSKVDPNAHQRLRLQVSEVLAAEPRIEDIRWGEAPPAE